MRNKKVISVVKSLTYKDLKNILVVYGTLRNLLPTIEFNEDLLDALKDELVNRTIDVNNKEN